MMAYGNATIQIQDTTVIIIMVENIILASPFLIKVRAIPAIKIVQPSRALVQQDPPEVQAR